MNQEQVQISPDQVKEVILDLWRKGHSKSDIGRILKEQYNIYDVRTIFGKRLTRVLEELGVKEEIPEDLKFLFRKAFKIMRHLEQNKHDTHSKKALEHVESKIKVLIKYYIRKNKLPSNFRYSKELVKIYGST